MAARVFHFYQAPLQSLQLALCFASIFDFSEPRIVYLTIHTIYSLSTDNLAAKMKLGSATNSSWPIFANKRSEVQRFYWSNSRLSLELRKLYLFVSLVLFSFPMWVQNESHPNPLRLEIITNIKQEADSLCSIKTKFTEKKKVKAYCRGRNYYMNLGEDTSFQNSISSKEVA